MAAMRRLRLGRIRTKYATATMTIRNRKADEEVEEVDLAAVVGVVAATRTETLFMSCI
jgi:hypothetical protein